MLFCLLHLLRLIILSASICKQFFKIDKLRGCDSKWRPIVTLTKPCSLISGTIKISYEVSKCIPNKKLAKYIYISQCGIHSPKHFCHFHSCQPETVWISIIVAGPSTMTLNERSGTEFFQAGTRRGQCLSRSLCPGTGMLKNKAARSV